MALVEWNDTFNLGIDELDADHRRLADFVNRAHELVIEDKDQDDLKALMDELIAHLRFADLAARRILQGVRGLCFGRRAGLCARNHLRPRGRSG